MEMELDVHKADGCHSQDISSRVRDASLVMKQAIVERAGFRSCTYVDTKLVIYRSSENGKPSASKGTKERICCKEKSTVAQVF